MKLRPVPKFLLTPALAGVLTLSLILVPTEVHAGGLGPWGTALEWGGKGLDLLIDYVKILATAAAILSFLAFLSYVAGVLFDLALSWTVLETGQLFSATDKLLPSIKEVWFIFRDIANVLIIGIFVFIAISTILGITKDNYRKMIVQLLTAALLVNFSFFFTQVVFDLSNWTAVQIYNATATENLPPRYSLFNESSTGETFSFSETFMEGIQMQSWMGIMGSLAGNVFSPVQNIFFVTLTATLLFAIIVLFMRIAIILIVRWLIMIFLMMTSSFALVARLIPKLNPYWKQWSDALVYNSTVAPALLLMLYVASVLAQAVLSRFPNTLANGIGSGQSRAQIMFTPEWNMELGLSITGSVLVIILLYMAIRIATSLADKAVSSAGGVGKFLNSGLGWMEGIMTGAAGHAMFGRMGLSGLGQRTLGRGAASMADALEKGTGSKNGIVNWASRKAIDMNLDKSLSAFGKRTFDPRNADSLKNILGKGGLGENAGSPIKKGFAALKKEDEEREAKYDKARKEKIFEEATATTVQATALGNLATEIGKQIESQNTTMSDIRKDMERANNDKNAATVNVDNAEKEVERMRNARATAQEALKNSGSIGEQEILGQMSQANSDIERLQKELAVTAISPEDAALKQGNLERLQARRERLAQLLKPHQEVQDAENRLQTAEGNLLQAKKNLENASQVHSAKMTELNDKYAEAQTEYDRLTTEQGKVAEQLKEVTAKLNDYVSQIPSVQKLRGDVAGKEARYLKLKQDIEANLPSVTDKDRVEYRDLEEKMMKHAKEVSKMMKDIAKSKKNREQEEKTENARKNLDELLAKTTSSGGSAGTTESTGEKPDSH